MNPFAFRSRSVAMRNARRVGVFLILVAVAVVALRIEAGLARLLTALLAGAALAELLLAFRVHDRLSRANATMREMEEQSRLRATQTATELTRAANRQKETLDHMLAGCQVIGFDWRYLYVNDAVLRHARKPREELVGHTMMACFPGIENTPMFAVLSRSMKERSFERIENEFAYPDGTTGWFELSVQPVNEGIFVVSIDITERKVAELSMRHQLDRLQSLRAIDRSILGATDLSLTLQTILGEARARLGCDGACIRLFDEEALTLNVAARCGNGPTYQASIHIQTGVMGRAARERRTICIPDLHQAEEDPLVSTGVRAVYSTPLVAKGRLTGVFTVTFDAPYRADPDWVDFFETVAGQAAMAIESGKLYEELQRSHLDLQLAYDTTIEGWSRALDLRDKETEGHTQRVTDLTLKLARKAGMSNAELVHVRRGALLHDIGKMGVPDNILLKPAALSDDEWVIMRRHPTYAYELLKPIEYLRDAIDIPLCHHEKWDGTGYPRGLRGEQIPLAARLFAVADVWDAIRSDRPYRSGWDRDRALEYIRSVAGTHLEPRAVLLFVEVLEEDEARAAEEALT